jgi:hypothetical protein
MEDDNLHAKTLAGLGIFLITLSALLFFAAYVTQ